MNPFTQVKNYNELIRMVESVATSQEARNMLDDYTKCGGSEPGIIRRLQHKIIPVKKMGFVENSVHEKFDPARDLEYHARIASGEKTVPPIRKSQIV